MQLASVRATARDLVRDFRGRLRPAVAIDDEEGLVAMVDAALVRGWGYGLRATNDLRAFAQLAWSVSPRFDEHPPFAQILADRTIRPADKLPRLWDAPPEDWVAAAAIAS